MVWELFNLLIQDYQGIFDKDGLQGNGTYIDLSQNFKWEGPFVNGKKNGQGVVTFR